ncbi:MAG: MarR family transcriptional regulator [Bacteroidota bacterium]
MDSPLAKEIKQRTFSNQAHRARINLLITTGWLKGELKSFLDEFGITQPQFNILRILRGAKGEPLSTKELSERMIDKMSDSSRLVDRLIAKDLAWKQPCPHDGRLVQVFLSDNGEQLLAQIDQMLFKLDAAFDGLSEEELTQLNLLLEKLRSFRQPRNK